MQDNPFKIYSASAGSGKTYTLTQEYLRLLLSSNDAYRQILAITFTNKAVNEMKDRILNNLYDFSQVETIKNAPPMFVTLSQELQLDAKSLQQKAKFILKKILHNYAYFDISTIDKFTHRLIRTFAKDLKLPQNFEVVLDTQLLLQEAVSRLINKAGTDKNLTKILIAFALEKTDDNKSWDVTIDLLEIGKLLFKEDTQPHLKKLENKELDDFLEMQKGIRNKINLGHQQIKKMANKCLEIIEEKNLKFSDFTSSYFPKFLIQLKNLERKINFDAKWKKDFENTSLYTKKCPEAIKETIDSQRSNFNEYFKTLKTTWEHLNFLKNVYKNSVPLTVLGAIQKEVKSIQHERDQLPISEFNSIISNEIRDQPAPFIYERLGEKYRHYFIDEFQDTSELQWKNLIPLVDNSLSSEHGSLFLVGDAKQAIYRWRGGEAEQFLKLVNKTENPFSAAPSIENLKFNYRSHKKIVDFNNLFFTAISSYLKNTRYRHLYKTGNEQISKSEIEGLVQLTFLNKNDERSLDELNGETVLTIIKEVIEKKYNYGDICILVRNKKDGVKLADYLIQEQIAVVSSDSLLLKNSTKVNFLINLLNYLIQPHDLEFSYNLLFYLSQDDENRHAFITKNLKNIAAFFLEFYQFNVLHLSQRSVFDIMEYAIKQFKLTENSDAYINFFMDTVFDVEQKEGTSIVHFLEYWGKKKDNLSIAAPDSLNKVQIMTIHKAKGLEFDITIFPYANANLHSTKDSKIWLSVNSDNFHGFEEVLINGTKEVVHYNDLAAKLFEEENNQQELDAFNVLYVALTRASKASYIITTNEPSLESEQKSYSNLLTNYIEKQDIWNENKSSYSFGQLKPITKEKKIPEQKPLTYHYTYKDRPSFKILTKSAQLWNTNREDAIVKGNLLHYIMSFIETHNDIESALNIALRKGILQENEKEDMLSTVLKIINHSKLRIYFANGNIVKNEKAIITATGKIIRPDRVVINKDKATIIDYKTGKPNNAFKEQIYEYADALEKIGYTVENKILLYINEKITPEFI